MQYGVGYNYVILFVPFLVLSPNINQQTHKKEFRLNSSLHGRFFLREKVIKQRSSFFIAINIEITGL